MSSLEDAMSDYNAAILTRLTEGQRGRKEKEK
jgi:hypothetical protein